MSSMKKVWMLLAAACLVSLLTACGDQTDTPTVTDTAPDTPAVSDSVSDSIPETTAESDPALESDTEGHPDIGYDTDVPVTSPDTEPETTPPVKLDGVRLDSKRISSVCSMANLMKASREEVDGEGYVLKLTSTAAGEDPNMIFNFKNYCASTGVDPFVAENYQYILMRVKNVNCSNGTFELFYFAGSDAGVVGDHAVSSSFNNATDEWQYLVFDMTSAAGWQGSINGFRFDYQHKVAAAGETLYISDILFAKNADEMNALIRSDMEDPFARETDPAVESKAEALLATPDKAPAADNTKLNAAHEDAGLDLWFNHAYTKTPAEDVTSTGWNTYTLRMAKNEAEGVHLLLASANGHDGISVSLTDFANDAGHTLKTELMYGYYFDDVDGKTIVDPTPWVAEGQTFRLDAGRSYMYIIKATSAIDSPAGLYSATVTVHDAEGKELKKAVVHAYVWNFALPEETSCKTQMDLSWGNIYIAHEQWDGDDSQLYKNYYDLLLANRICAYSLPYNNAFSPADTDLYADERIREYLDNPRVVAFNPVNWKNHNPSDEELRAVYAYLSQKPEWLDKAYFYFVDEPIVKADLDRILTYAEQLKRCFPDYKMMSPMHLNYALNSESTEDYLSYVKDVINVWCYKPYFYTTYAQYSYDRALAYRMTPALEKNLGTFADRMEREQAEGDELWWYVTRRPEDPEITILMDTESVRHRILFWQQKLYNVDSFLYYLANDWFEIGENNGLNKKYEHADGVDGLDCYGNGVLIYCGQDFGIRGGVGSLRLENVRDGIEDFEYLTMIESLYGKEVADAIICRLTTSIAHYNTDIDHFTDLRVSLGNILEEALAEKN